MTSNVPIALEIKALDSTMNDVLLSHVVSLEVEHNTHILKIGGTDEKVKVSPKCLDQIRLLVHQLHLYQRTATAIAKVAKSDRVEETFVFYMSLISYFGILLTAFLREAKADSSSSNSKWRSAHLDYHMTLALHGNAFTMDQQTVAMQEIKRSWNHFREKKIYRKVQALHGKKLHDEFCVGGDNMCGGSFEHARSEEEMIASIINSITSEDPDQQLDERDAPTMESVSSERAQSERKELSTSLNASQDGMHVDNTPTHHNLSGKRKSTSSSASVKKDSRRKENDVVEGSGHSKKDVIHTDDEGKDKQSHGKKNVIESPGPEAESDRELNLPISDHVRLTAEEDGSSPINMAVADVDGYPIESISEDMENRLDTQDETRNLPKERKNVRKGKGKKAYGKKRAPQSPLLEVESEEEEARPIPQPGLSLEQNDETSGIDLSDVDAEGYDTGPLPPNQDKWEALTRLAFEKGNSQIFLKLATWMLVRFRDLTNLDMDSELDGPLISQNPRLMEELDDDHYFEAVGMERLYSAIVHMESRPRYMCHLFHALGKRLTESEVGNSNPRIWPSRSPPAVQREMLNDVDMTWLKINDNITQDPWLAFTNVTDNDAEGSVDIDNHDVTQALDSMMIEDNDVHINHETHFGTSRLEKRKRTMSQASPPKNDGGRGTPKRSKKGSQTSVRSSSIIQYSPDLDQSGFINSPTLPLSSQMSTVSSHADNVSEIMEAWDDPIQTHTNDNETTHEDATQQSSNVCDEVQVQHSREDQNNIAASTSGDEVRSSSPVILVHSTQPSSNERDMDITPDLTPDTNVMTQPQDTSACIPALPGEPSSSAINACTKENVTPPRINAYDNSQIELVGENDPPPYVT
ncbi:hypothetical protein BDR06DRAFT_1015240 [Suillus hirtellus]|nr:hypothetical protein BDR06DRAFT_1015240 [Suillus hirtellus]